MNKDQYIGTLSACTALVCWFEQEDSHNKKSLYKSAVKKIKKFGTSVELELEQLPPEKKTARIVEYLAASVSYLLGILSGGMALLIYQGYMS